MTSTEIVPAGNLSALEHMDPSVAAAAVTQYLERARDQLTLAVNLSGPEAVAALKAEIATAAEATKQLGLSQEIQADAQEMVRRAEYALGKAIRAGQERGEIARSARETGGGADLRSRIPTSSKPTDFASHGELVGNEGTGIYGLVDGVRDAEFDVALSDARDEGNLSRANVVRKIKAAQQDGLTPVERLVKLRELAPTGMTAGAIAKELGVTESYVRDRAREQNIEIAASKATRNTRRLDGNRVIESTVMDASNVVSPSLVAQINFAELDRESLGEWVSSLSESIRALQALKKSLEKELNRG